VALEEYNRKRDFRRTPEPAGRSLPRKKPAAALSFVVQKHAATRLHYDFRLELNGVLLSWAIPKGPSLDPGEKRLAVQTEDHPIEYGGFEGVIPKGQYGGGTVLLWDRGTWSPIEPDPEAAYKKGALKFRLDGEKLHGNWALVRMGGKAAREGRENWLLIKERDEEAVPGSDSTLVDDNPLSVATGRSMDAIATERDRVWDSHKGELPGDPMSAKLATRIPWTRPAGARRGKMPDKIVPQLAALADSAPEGDVWLHELKYDGYRLLAYIETGDVRLVTRNSLDWTAKFPALARGLAQLPIDSALIDGEIVALTPDGSTSFAELQDALSRRDTGGLIFYAFDLLYRDGYDLTGAVLEDRKASLAEILPREGMVRYSDHQQGRGPEVLRHVCEYGVEGIVSKRRDRPFRPGRGSDWLKIKCRNDEEFVVIGFTEPNGQRQGFGALLLGYYDTQGKLRYAGRVGTGFSDTLLADLHRRLDKLQRRTAPAAVPKGVPLKGVHWVKPRLVGQVQFSNWTTDRILRHAAFQGLREDKNPEEVVYPVPDRQDPQTVAILSRTHDTPPPQAGEGSARSARVGAKAAAARTAGRSESPHPALPRKRGRVAGNKGEGPSVSAPARDGSVIFDGVRLTNPGRVLYPDLGITKLALAQYYAAIGDWALPELKDRVLSLVRCPEGYTNECFYQKHVMAGVPDIVGRVEITEKTSTDTSLFVRDVAGLIALVQLSILEIHPWGSTVAKLETPDRITFDFDPDVGLPWERVTEAAIEMREALLGIGLQSFPKTTGGKGLHVVVPVTPKLEWDAIKEFAKWVSERFTAAYPDRFTTNMAKRARTGRIFIDYLRNGRGATAIGAYSPRARAGAPVATPLFWEEVEKGVKPDGFTVETLPARLAKLTSDPWAELRQIRQSISARVRKEVGI
jgi:bifunctional non-homologous end joining protein LigD